MTAGRVTGIGGIFFKCDDPAGLLDWYESAFDLTADEGGGIWFAWTDSDGRTARSGIGPFREDTDYFDPGTQPFMVNYRVDDLDALLTRLRASGENVIDTGYESDDGRFAWVIDPDGQKVELWEPSGRPGPATTEGAVTGLGGIFFKSPDRAALKEWYRTRLGIEPDDAGYVVFSWLKEDGRAAYLSWEVFADDTDYFDPGTQPFMINLRVRDLDTLRERLLADETTLVDPKVDTYEYGKFGWIKDPAGIRIELWEPNDGAFDAVEEDA